MYIAENTVMRRLRGDGPPRPVKNIYSSFGTGLELTQRLYRPSATIYRLPD